MTVAGCGKAADPEVLVMFREAEQHFESAAGPEDYERVAGEYQEILDRGFHSGSVLFNQGNAWMQAGKTGLAIAGYRQAQRLLPRDPYLRANLNAAISKVERRPADETTIADQLFFWQDQVSFPEKARLATAVLLSLITANILTQLRRVQPYHGVLKNVQRGLTVLLVLSVATVARDWYRYEYLRHGVVIDETTARKGASAAYEPAFTADVPEGTEFEVRERREDWLHVTIAGVGDGWLPDRNCVTY
ncbi:MAG: hypothetical protein KDA89_05385 [Planctomycetaceae bacterium]|nr:hypothetical protein [Planctomycetaceae bacterium]